MNESKSSSKLGMKLLHCTTDFLGATSSGNERMWNRHPELGGWYSFYFFWGGDKLNKIQLQGDMVKARNKSRAKSGWYSFDIRLSPGISGSDAPVFRWNTMHGCRRGSGYRGETRQEAGLAIYKARHFRCCRFTETVRVWERDHTLVPSLACADLLLHSLSLHLPCSPSPSPSLGDRRRSAGGGAWLNAWLDSHSFLSWAPGFSPWSEDSGVLKEFDECTVTVAGTWDVAC